MSNFQRRPSHLQPIMALLFLCCRIRIACSLAPNLPPLKGNNYHTSHFGPRQNHPTSYDPCPNFLGSIRLEKRWTDDVPSNAPDSSPSSTKAINFDAGRERIRHYYRRKNLPLDSIFGKAEPLTRSSPTRQKLKAIADHLARHDAPVDVKEVCESIEFVLRTRKRLWGAAKQRQRVREPRRRNDEDASSFGDEAMGTEEESIRLYDLCCGHGLTGMLFGCCGAGSDQTRLEIILVDQKRPPSHSVLFDLLSQICPWIADPDSVAFLEADLSSATSLADLSPPPVSVSTAEARRRDPGSVTNLVISTHACGSLTDSVLEVASTDVNGISGTGAAAIAVMPCCYTGTSRGAPHGIQRALGVAWAADIQRSFYLQERGYHSDFSTIPREISPMNRILIGEKGSRQPSHRLQT